MGLRDLGRALGMFRVFDPTHFYLHHVLVFLVVATADPAPVTYEEVMEELDLNNSSVSRTLNALSDLHRSGEPGLGLVDIDRDRRPGQGRRYVARLTSKGKALAKQIQAI